MLRWTRRTLSLLNTKVSSVIDAPSDIAEYLKEAPSHFNCIVTGAWGAGKSFSVDKSLLNAKCLESLIDIDCTEVMNSADKPTEGVDNIGIELIEQFTVATSAFLKVYEHSLDDAAKTDLRHKLVTRGKAFFDTVMTGQPPLNKEDAADRQAFKGRIVDTVNAFIEDYKRVIRMTSWNWDQMHHVLSKVSLADAYSIVSSIYLTMQFEDTFEDSYGLSSAEAMLEVVSCLSSWLISCGCKPAVLRLRDPEYFYYDSQLTVFFMNFLKALQERQGNFYTIIEMNGVVSPAFELLAKDTRNINYEIRPANREETTSLAGLQGAEIKPEVQEVLDLTGGSPAFISIVSVLLSAGSDPAVIKETLLKQSKEQLTIKLAELLGDSLATDGATSGIFDYPLRRTWLESLFRVDMPVKRAVAYILSRVLEESNQAMAFSHMFYSQNALVQQLALISILRYNWAEQVLSLEKPMYASHLLATDLMGLTQTRMSRFKNFLAFRGTWSKL
jgi:hypothetical protein